MAFGTRDSRLVPWPGLLHCDVATARLCVHAVARQLFGATRTRFLGRGRRLLYAVLAPGLPVLLLARMSRVGLRTAHRRSFVRALAPLAALTVAWSVGEWLGYVTGRRPRDLSAAPGSGTR